MSKLTKAARDERDWTALEAAHAEEAAKYEWIDCAPAVSTKVHPQSYEAQFRAAMRAQERAWTKRKQLEKQQAAAAAPTLERVRIRPSAAHPDSYRADLPLRGLALEKRKSMPKWTLSADERTALAKRPLRYGSVATLPVLAQTLEAARVLESKLDARAAALEAERVAYAALLATLNASKPVASLKKRARSTVSAASVLRTPAAPHEQPRAINERDAIRRAFVALLKGRAAPSPCRTHYLVTDARTKRERMAPWSAIVTARYSDPDAFEAAARAWMSPKNERTLATH